MRSHCDVVGFSRAVALDVSRYAFALHNTTLNTAAMASIQANYLYNTKNPNQGINGQYEYVLDTQKVINKKSNKSPAKPAENKSNSNNTNQITQSKPTASENLAATAVKPLTPASPPPATSLNPAAVPKSPSAFDFDEEPIAPDGTAAREAQLLRTNPLLNPKFRSNLDAAGLGFGARHDSHYRYRSHYRTEQHWEQEAKFAAEGQYNISSNHYRYRTSRHKSNVLDAAALGYGHPHNKYGAYTAGKTEDDVLKHYKSKEQLEKFYHTYA
jgi:hypothetical protein